MDLKAAIDPTIANPLDMVKYISLLLFIAVIQGQPIDEIEILHSKNDKFFFQPESLYKSEGFWYTANNKPATLRLQIYSKNNNGQKNSRVHLSERTKK